MDARLDVAYVSPRNGAYLIHFVFPGSEELTDVELFSAASSLAKAKRIARQEQPDFVLLGTSRWREEGRMWVLEARVTSDYE